MTDFPSFLGRDLKAKLAKAKAAAQAASPPQASQHPQAPSNPTKPKPTKATAKTPAVQNDPSDGGAGAGNPSDAQRTINRGAKPDQLDVEGLADRMLAAAGNQAEAQLLRPVLPSILAALVDGARLPGAKGAADRKALFQLMALPFVAADGKKAGAMAADILGRLGQASARRERQLSGASGAADVTPAQRKAH